MNVLKLRLNYQNDVRIIWIYPYYNQMILCSFFPKPSQFKPLFSAFAKVPDTRWHQQALTTRPGLFFGVTILVLARLVQSSYLSRTSRIISLEKNLSCGEISDFCKEFEQFMAFYRNLCRFCSKFVWRKIFVEKISVGKNKKYEI